MIFTVDPIMLRNSSLNFVENVKMSVKYVDMLGMQIKKKNFRVSRKNVRKVKSLESLVVFQTIIKNKRVCNLVFFAHFWPRTIFWITFATFLIFEKNFYKWLLRFVLDIYLILLYYQKISKSYYGWSFAYLQVHRRSGCWTDLSPLLSPLLSVRSRYWIFHPALEWYLLPK